MCKIFKLFLKKDKLNTLKEQHDKAAETVANTQKEIINEIMHEYNDEYDRNQLILDARKYNFSENKLTNIEQVFNNFNQDNITYNLAVDVIEARNFILGEQKESFFSTIANIIPEDESTDVVGE